MASAPKKTTTIRRQDPDRGPAARSPSAGTNRMADRLSSATARIGHPFCLLQRSLHPRSPRHATRRATFLRQLPRPLLFKLDAALRRSSSTPVLRTVSIQTMRKRKRKKKFGITAAVRQRPMNSKLPVRSARRALGVWLLPLSRRSPIATTLDCPKAPYR